MTTLKIEEQEEANEAAEEADDAIGNDNAAVGISRPHVAPRASLADTSVLLMLHLHHHITQ